MQYGIQTCRASRIHILEDTVGLAARIAFITWRVRNVRERDVSIKYSAVVSILRLNVVEIHVPLEALHLYINKKST